MHSGVFIHAKHPEIAAKWDAEARGKKRSASKKVSKGWAKPIGIGVGASAVGGVAANQVPPVQKTEWGKEHLHHKRSSSKRKKGQIKKMLVPVSDDPFFNQEAAQKTFDLIMKMDDDTAEMFCHIVASDLLEREVEQNRVTLQKHLDEVVAKRLSDLKKATLRAVSKGMENPEPYAQSLAMIDSMINKASANEANDNPNWAFERKIRRDPQSGRFQQKVSNKPIGKKPIPKGTWDAITEGHGGTDKWAYGRGGAGMSKEEHQARFQSQYLQVANFLDAVHAATGGTGNSEVLIHYQNDAGDTWADQHTGAKPPVENHAVARPEGDRYRSTA